MFLDPKDFPFTAAFEENADAIRTEFEALAPGDFMAWPERFLYQDGWDVFGLWAYGSPMEANCRRCPRTMEVAKSVPGLTTIGFSILRPGAEIVPHKGFTNHVLRCHLGIIVPEDCRDSNLGGRSYVGIRRYDRARGLEPVGFDTSRPPTRFHARSR